MKKIGLLFAFVFSIIFSKAQLAYQWANSAGSAANAEYGQAIASDPSGNVYVTGLFIGTVDFDPSASTASLTSLSGSKDIFLAKYNSAGAFVWVKQIAGTNDEKPYDLVADASGAYLAGNFLGTVDFDPGAAINNIVCLGGGTDGDGFFAKYDVNGNLSWVDRIGSTVNDRVTSIAIDASANVYVTGFIGGNADMDPSAASASLTVSGTYNAYIGKYTSAGAYVYAKQITGGYSEGDDINVDASGNIYLTGSYATTNDFDPSGTTANLSTSSLTQLDIFLAKYTNAGVYTFAKQIGGIGVDIGYQVVPDAAGNIYLGGVFSSTCDFDPTAATSTLTSAGSGDLFVAKYDASGNLTWKTGTGGTNNDYCFGLGLDVANNVYITGKVQGTNIDFDPSASSALLSSASSCMYIASYSSAGSFLSLSSPTIASIGNGLCVNSSLYIAGTFAGTGDFDFSASTANLTSLGSDDVFFAKYNVSSCPLPAQPSAISGNFTVCSGTSNTYSVTNDPLATSYTWSFPAGWTGTSTTNVIVPTVSAGGIISVVATNSCGSSPSQTVNIVTGPSGATVTTSSSNCGNANGSATVTGVSDGVPAFQYAFNGGPFVSSAIQTGMIAGPKNVIIKDANACTFTLNFNIGNTGSPVASIASLTNVSCFGGSNGGFSVSVTGGVPAYTYTLIPGNITNGTGNFTNLSAGVYTITVKDGVGCITTILASITQTTSLNGNATSTNVSCFNLNNGVGSFTYTGGTAPYNVFWQPSLATTTLVNNLAPGIHTVTVTDANSCTLSKTITIFQPTMLVANITTVVPTNCGQANGSSSVAASGGLGGYTYLWTAGPTYTNALMNNVVSAAYTVTVTDANGCTALTNTVIPNIAAPQIVITNTMPANCFGSSTGGATVSAFGGSGPLTFLWSYLSQTTQNVNNLPAGTHTITVTDPANCAGSATVNITQAASALVTSITSVTSVACNGNFNGAAQITASGGAPGYTYLWSPSAQTNSVLTGVGSGIYTCSVTDVNGCVSTKTVSITQPAPLLITTNTVIPNNCFGFATGQINTSISGGNPTYTLTWNPAQPSNPVITNLVLGTYSLFVMDAKGCTTFSVYTLTDPPALVVQATSTTAACSGPNGSASVIVGGGAPAYTYSWSPNSQTTNSATGLPAGNYVLTTTDAKGCIINASLTIPSGIIPTLTVTSTSSAICAGQTATLSANGASSYSWNTSASSQSISISPTTNTTYTVTGTGNGCSASAIITQSVSLCTGINSFENINAFVKIYPNPFSNQVTISLIYKDENTELYIYNSTGQLVHKAKLEEMNSILKLEYLTAGIYFLNIGNMQNNQAFKLIKE